MRKKAVTLTEVLIAISIGVAILLPTTFIFSNSSKELEKASNLSFASGLARYIVQTMLTMQIDDIKDTDQNGILCCDDYDDNIYFQTLFNFKEKFDDFEPGIKKLNQENCPKLYNRLAKYEYRYFINKAIENLDNQITASIYVQVRWKEFGEDKFYGINFIIFDK